MNKLISLLLVSFALAGCVSTPEKVVVTDEERRPVRNAAIQIIDYTTRLDPAFTQTTDSLGNADLSRFRNISGMWTIFISKEGFENQRIENTAVGNLKIIEVVLRKTTEPGQDWMKFNPNFEVKK